MRSFSRFVLGCVVGSFGAFGAERSANADDLDLEALLEKPVVSTASQMAETESQAPATSTVITAEDLRRYGIHSLDEAINFLSLGMVSTNPLHSVEVGARGVLFSADFGNHVLLLVNGHLMNEQWDGTAYYERGMAVPLELIDHVEIILGPGSVLYGSYAMLGVINVITKRAKDYKGLHLIVESEIPTSMRYSLGYGREFKLFGRNAEVTFQAEYFGQSGPTFKFGPQPVGNDSVTGQPARFGSHNVRDGFWGGSASRSYFTQIPSAYLRVLMGNTEVNVRGATYKRGTPFLSQFNQGAGDFDDPRNYELDRWLSLDIRHRIPVSSVVELRARVYGDVYDFQQPLQISAAQDCLEGQVGGCKAYTFGGSRWAGLEVQSNLDWLRDGRLVTLLGTEGRLRHVAQYNTYTDAATGITPPKSGNVSSNDGTLAVYLQQVAKPSRRISANAGVRFDADPRFGRAFSPRVALAYSPWKDATLKGIYAEAFRAPTFYEQYYSDPGEQVPAKHLDAERMRGVEASFEQNLGTQRLLFGAFRSWWRNIVSLETATAEETQAGINAGVLIPSIEGAVIYRNVGTVDSYGWNAAYEGTLLQRKLRYGLNVTGAYSRRTQSTGEAAPFAVTPSFFGNTRAAYDLGGQLPTLAIAGYLQGRAPADRAFDGGFTPTPYSPTQVVLRGTISGVVPGVKGLLYRFTANYAAAARGPYVVGENQAATPSQTRAELVPVDRFRTGIGLQYDFDP